MLMGRSLSSRVAGAPFLGTYAVPKLALFPIFPSSSSHRQPVEIALVFLECSTPRHHHQPGSAQRRRVLLWSEQNMDASRVEILRRIVIPATAPFIFAGSASPCGGDDRGGDHGNDQLRDGLGYQVIYARFRSRRTACSRSWSSSRCSAALDRTLVVLRDRLYTGKNSKRTHLEGTPRELVLALLTVFASSIPSPTRRATLIRFGRGFAAEEQVWLMSARPDLAPSQGKKYQLKQILFQANPERFQALPSPASSTAGRRRASR